MTGGFYPGARGRTRLRRLLRQGDDDSIISKGLVTREPVSEGSPGHVTYERVTGLCERDDAVGEGPSSHHVDVEVAAALVCTRDEQPAGGRAVRLESDRQRRAGGRPVRGAGGSVHLGKPRERIGARDILQGW